MATERLATGARIGDYVVDRELAKELSSVRYLATHVVLPRQAHVKVTHAGSRSAAVQLLREACILEALSHPGIPRVHECGVLGDRRPWCAIELLPGVTLERYTRESPIALSDLVVAVRDVADILRHAHDRGVVHRGLTAATILRTQRKRSGYAITGWGDACTLDTAGGVTVDPRDDVFALGAIAFHALTGKPADGSSAAAHCPSAPAELIALIDQMLAEPVARPVASEAYDRALWLCDTLEAPLRERPRWTPPQGFARDAAADDRGFTIRIGRTRTSDPA
jgi:serine/threonine-protein kinase